MMALLAFSSVEAVELDRRYGEASYQFLKLSLSPRIIGMGGAGAALSARASESSINPAAAARAPSALYMMRGIPFREFDNRLTEAHWNLGWGDKRVLLSGRYLGYENIRGFDEAARPTADYASHSLGLAAGLAANWRDLSWGATVSYAENSVAYANYATVMGNLGVVYRLPMGFSIGGSGMHADLWRSDAFFQGNESPFPPTTAQAGLGWQGDMTEGFSLAIAVDARTRNDEKLALPTGAELVWRDILLARVGFPFLEPEPGIQMGLGLSWDFIEVEYAFQSHETLSPAHYWLLGIRF